MTDTPPVRFVEESDAPQIHAIYAPVVTNTAVSFAETPPSVDQMAERIRETRGRYPWLVCERHGVIVGYTCAATFRQRRGYDWTVEVSVYVRPDAQREGIASRLYESLFEVLRLQGFVNAIALITLPNVASVTLHERLGFERVGVLDAIGFKLGAWQDVGWWQMCLQSPASAPRNPKPVREVEMLEGGHAALWRSRPDP